jgi:hypothetical protein
LSISGKPDVTLIITDGDLVDLMTGKLNSQKAFFQGKLKVNQSFLGTETFKKKVPSRVNSRHSFFQRRTQGKDLFQGKFKVKFSRNSEFKKGKVFLQGKLKIKFYLSGAQGTYFFQM